jgi:hypothetical protein
MIPELNAYCVPREARLSYSLTHCGDRVSISAAIALGTNEAIILDAGNHHGFASHCVTAAMVALYPAGTEVN